MSCSVIAGDFTGQIFWIVDDTRETFHHLSHFGERRLGVGTGTIDAKGNLESRIEFTDEPGDTYRIYEYRWVTPDEYLMISRQFSAEGELTGNWYGGTFIRVAD